MTIKDLFPSRLTVAAVAGCAVLLPAAVFASWQWGLANAEKVSAERAHKRLDDEVNAPVTGLRFQYAQCLSDRGNLQAATEAQSAAVDAMKAEADRRADQAAQAVSAARQRQRAAEARARALMAQAPRPGETLCEAADRIILEAVQ